MTTDTVQDLPRARAARLGRYEVMGPVGRGGMAEVLLAREAGSLDRWVAIKRVHPELAKQKKFVQMLLDEARLSARIAHPNVAQVLDLGEDDGIPYIVMEYLHGQPLSEVIHHACEDGASPDLDLMARIVADAAEGLHAAHELRDHDGRKLGLVHRDLSPHNVFVTYAGAVKVVDFGIAKARGRMTLTEPGTVKGKFAYMSPEQARGHELDRRSDVYALGLVLYEATTGVQVFEGGDIQVLARVALSSIEPPSRYRRDYPAALQQVVMKALEAKREDRFQTAREMAQELERFIVGRQALTDPAQVASMVADLFPDQRAIGSTAGSSSDPSGERPPTTTTVSARSQPILPNAWWRTPLLVACIATIIGCVVAVGIIVSRQLGHEEVVRSRSIADDRPASVPPVRERPTARPTAKAGTGTPTVGPEIRETSQGAEQPTSEAGPDSLPDDFPERDSAPGSPEEAPPGPRKGQGHHGRSAQAADSAAGTGTLDVRSEPWSMVWVDGRSVQPTPMVGLPLSAGQHILRLVTEDGRSKTRRITVSPGRSTSVEVRFDR